MSGLAEAAEKTLQGRGVECPNCGAALQVKLATTQSIVCHAVQVGGRRLEGRRRRPRALRAGQRQRAADPARQRRHAGVRHAGRRCRGRSSAMSSAARCRAAATTTTIRRSSGASTCCTTAPKASRSSSMRRTAGAGPRRSPACRRRSATASRHDGVLYRKLYDYTGKVDATCSASSTGRSTRDQLTRNSDYQGTGAAAQKRLNRERTDERRRPARSSGRPARRSTPTRC